MGIISATSLNYYLTFISQLPYRSLFRTSISQMKATAPKEAASNFMDLPGCRKAVIGGDRHLGSPVYVVPKKAPV